MVAPPYHNNNLDQQADKYLLSVHIHQCRPILSRGHKGGQWQRSVQSLDEIWQMGVRDTIAVENSAAQRNTTTDR